MRWRYVTNTISKGLLENNIKEFAVTTKDHDIFLQEVVSNLGTLFTSPEEYATVEGEKTLDMFFIISGACSVSMHDPVSQRDLIFRKVLVESDYFGEIGCLFKCRRTASVSSSRYSTLARLTLPRLRQIMSDYPGMLMQMRNHLFNYKDPYKDFMFKILNRVPYLSNLCPTMFHKVIYGMTNETYEKNE